MSVLQLHSTARIPSSRVRTNRTVVTTLPAGWVRSVVETVAHGVGLLAIGVFLMVAALLLGRSLPAPESDPRPGFAEESRLEVCSGLGIPLPSR
jgi:hypothetical protein